MKRFILKLLGIGKKQRTASRKTKVQQPRALERLQHIALRDTVYHEQKAGTLA
jgi:hypothetical protein